MKETYWIGLDLGGTKMLCAVFNRKFEILGSRKRKTKAYEGLETTIERIGATVEDAIADAGIKPGQVAGMGIGSAGMLDLNKGIILHSFNLGWSDVPITKTLEKRFGFSVVLINDVDASIYGEYHKGAAAGARCALGVFPGTGIGGGCVHTGELLTGEKHSAVEIGHMLLEHDGPLCGCGLFGCREASASRLAIASQAAAAAYRGESPFLLENGGTDLKNIRSGLLAQAIDGGDKIVGKIVKHAAYILGKSIGAVINVLTPDIVVLGGGLVEALPELYLKEVHSGAMKTVMPPYKDQFEVKVSSLGDDSAITGAATWAQHTLEKE